MSLEALIQAEKRAVGVKQTEKAVLKKSAVKVYIAADADERVTDGLESLCLEHGIEMIKADTMQELGKACGIHVKAAAAAILEN